MTTWIRQPQEKSGTYFFSGKFIVAQTVIDRLTLGEIQFIVKDIAAYVGMKQGVDKIVEYVDQEDVTRKLLVVDQLNKDMIDSGLFRKKDNCCILLWAEDYL